MKITMISLLIYVTVFIYILSSCKNRINIRGENSDIQEEYTKVEIYCFCINDYHSKTGNTILVDCTSPGKIQPSEIISPKNLFDSTSDRNVIQALKRIFFEQKQKAETIDGNSDSRLIFLFKKNSLFADTLVFYSDEIFNLNGNYQFIYPFNVIDSVESILRKDKISCPRYPGYPENAE
jgi:hypothetical protein